MNISRADLEKLPWLDLTQVGRDRVLHMMPIFEDGAWADWIPLDDGRLIQIRPLDVRGLYLSAAPAHPVDLQFEFLETIWQRVSYPGVAKAAAAIGDDVQNLATSLAKVDFFARHAAELGHGVAAFAVTEIEYMLVVARSLLDHLHEVTRELWGTIELVDPQQQRVKASRELPKKISKTCLTPTGRRSAADLAAVHAFPPAVAGAYAEVGGFLEGIRRLRDGIVHRGRSPGPIFLTPRGFGIGRHGALSKAAPEIWREHHVYNDNVVSLRPLLAHIADGSLRACSSVTSAFSSCIRLPGPLAPRHRVFLRADHAHTLHEARAVLAGGDAWWPPPEHRNSAVS